MLSRQAGAAILLTNVASTAEATSLGLSSYISAAVADHATMDARISVAIATATSTGAQASSQLSAVRITTYHCVTIPGCLKTV